MSVGNSNYLFTHNTQVDHNYDTENIDLIKRTLPDFSIQPTSLSATQEMSDGQPDVARKQGIQRSRANTKQSKPPPAEIDPDSVFEYPFLENGQRHPNAQYIPEPNPIKFSIKWGNITKKDPLPTPDETIDIKTVEECIRKFKDEDLININNEFRRIGQQARHEYCKDDSTLGHVKGALGALPRYIEKLPKYMKCSNMIVKVTNIYAVAHENYKARIATLKQRYDDLGDEAMARAEINRLYDPQIKMINDQTALLDASRNLTQTYVNNYINNIIPSITDSSSVAKDGAVIKNNENNKFNAEANEKLNKYYKTIKVQNDNLAGKLIDINSGALENDRKMNYKMVGSNNLFSIKYILFIFYYVLLLIMTGMMIMSYYTKPMFDSLKQLGIICALGIFPFVIYDIEMWLYNFWIYWASMLKGSAHTSYEYSIVNENKKSVTTTTNSDTDELRKPKQIIPNSVIDYIRSLM